MAEPLGTENVWHQVEEMLTRALIPATYYVDASCIVLTLYEYLLTFNAERRVIWGRKLTLPTLLFLLNRYSLWLFSISTILWNLVDWDTNKVGYSELLIWCHMAGVFNLVVAVLIELVGEAFNAIRIHAINGRRWFWTCIVLLLPCFNTLFDMGTLFSAKFQTYKGTATPLAHGCFDQIGDLGPAIAAQACACMSSAIAFCITSYRTGEIVYMGQKARTRTSLASLMLRSGTLFFLMDLIFTVVQMFFLLKTSWVQSTATIVIVRENTSVDSIVRSRFILNLRLLDSRDGSLRPMSSINIPGLPRQNTRFSALDLANMGAPLDLDRVEEDEDEDEDEDGDGLSRSENEDTASH